MGQAPSAADKEVTLQHIQELYRKFANQCPSGNLHLHEFKKIFGINQNSTAEESAYTENVFRSFDTNRVTYLQEMHSGSVVVRPCLTDGSAPVPCASQDSMLDFMEYVAAVHLVLRGKLEDKLKWSFKVYDRDGNGCLDREEVRHVVKVSIQSLLLVIEEM